MQALILAFWQVLSFERGPDSFPASRFLLILTSVVFVLFGALGSWLRFANPLLNLAVSAIELGLLLLFCAFVLAMTNHPKRFTQTASTLTGAIAFIQGLSLPVVAMIVRPDVDKEGFVFSLAAFAIIGFAIWQIAVVAHIYRHALETTVGRGVIVALGYFLFSLSLMLPLARYLQPEAG